MSKLIFQTPFFPTWWCEKKKENGMGRNMIITDATNMFITFTDTITEICINFYILVNICRWLMQVNGNSSC